MSDLFITNALIETMDPDFPRADTVALKDGRIMAVGDRDKLKGFINNRTEIVNLNGRTVLPGFIDAHLHLRALAESLVTLNISPERGISCITDVQERIYRESLKRPPGTWIRAGGYNDIYLSEQRDPNRWDLDTVSPDHPVKLTHRSGHAQVLNSRALKLLNITIETTDPPGGLMERDLETGEPTGVFYGPGDFLSALIPPLDSAQLDQGVKLANQELIKAGITSFQDASPRNDLERWRSFERWQVNSFLDSRVVMMLGLKGFEEYQSDQFPMIKDKNRLKPGGVKIILDETIGKLFPSQKDLNEIVLSIHKAGLQAAIHAIEETAVEAACIAIEQAQLIYPRKDRRHRIEHCSLCPPSLAGRIAALGAMVVSNPAFIYFSGERYLKTVPPSQFKYLYPFSTLIKNDVYTAAGSDAPIAPVNPLAGICGAVTRRAKEGGIVLEKEKIGVYEAVAMYTGRAARSSFDEHQKGMIAPGKLADLVVLSDNPFKVPEEAIKDIQVEMTIMGGKMVYRC
jgi:predicted amidohydrolase YtcJ